MDITRLPKAELHCHMDGIIDWAMLTTIHADDPSYPVHPDVLQGVEVKDYESFWAWGPRLMSMRRHLPYYYPILKHYISALKRQNVRYLELFLAGGDLPQDTTEAVDAMHVLREFVDQQEDGQIQVEFLIASGRQNTLEYLQARSEKILALYEAGLICGIAIAGPEPGNPVAPITGLLQEWHEAGLGIEVHAGEWVGPESVWDALEYGYPDRIGHGVSLFQDSKLIEHFQEAQIHIEMCPTSNLKTGSIQRIEDHPIRQALDLGLNFSVNTDDPGPFGCTMQSEYELLVNTFGFTEDDLMKVYKNSLNARFQKELRVRV